MEAEQNTENQILQLQEIEGNLRHILMKKEKGMIIREEVMKVLFVPMITEEELKAR